MRNQGRRSIGRLLTGVIEVIDHIPTERIGEPQPNSAYIVGSNEFM